MDMLHYPFTWKKYQPRVIPAQAGIQPIQKRFIQNAFDLKPFCLQSAGFPPARD
jgi:hypothetical protein